MNLIKIIGVFPLFFAVLVSCLSCSKDPTKFDRYEETSFFELIENGSQLDGTSVSVEGLLSSNSAATILESVEKLPFTFDELGVPWVSIEDPNWEFRKPMVPRLVRIYGDYQKYSMDHPTLGRLTNIRLIEMHGIKEELLLPHQREGDDPNDPFKE